jgi:ribosome biogenesis GTPase
MNLNEIGWNNFFEDNFNRIKIEGQKAARVTGEQRNLYRIMSEDGELTAEVSGKLRYRSQSRADFPAVGDWVVIEPVTDESKAVIHSILPRKSAFSRKAVLSGGMPDTGGKTDEQILAANIDTVFLVSGLDGDFNIRRIERYVTIAWDSGATPVIVLNKIDLCDDLEATIEQVETVAFGVDILPVSATDGAGLE